MNNPSLEHVDEFPKIPDINLSPLSKYYRIPGLHIKIPTMGKFMPPGSIEFTMTGEIEVYPMAAKDELLLKSPDALMSGLAIEKLLESCVPGIKHPRYIATQDLDVLLLAIRAATYGDIMHLDTECPNCKKINDIICQLPVLLATMKFVEDDNIVQLTPELQIFVRPYNIINATTLAMASYEEARKLQAMQDANPPVSSFEKNKASINSLEKINKLNFEMISDCIIKIVDGTASFTNKKHINDFVSNVPKPWVEKISEKLKSMNTKGIDKSLHISCSECKHEWDTEVEFNPSNFFDADSLE